MLYIRRDGIGRLNHSHDIPESNCIAVKKLMTESKKKDRKKEKLKKKDNLLPHTPSAFSWLTGAFTILSIQKSHMRMTMMIKNTCQT